MRAPAQLILVSCVIGLFVTLLDARNSQASMVNVIDFDALELLGNSLSQAPYVLPRSRISIHQPMRTPKCKDLSGSLFRSLLC